MLHGCLGIGKFSPSFENTVQHLGENVVSLHVHVISSMYDISYMHIILFIAVHVTMHPQVFTV